MSETELERSRRVNARPNNSVLVPCDKLKEMQETLASYKRVLVDIANDYPELSHDKARMQNLDHIKWAKEVLNEAI